MSNEYGYFRTQGDRTIFVKNLIAFYPTYGYMIFNGYSRIESSDLPYIEEFIRCERNGHENAYFNIEITETYKKDLPSPPSKQHCTHDDTCECHIYFFSLDIVILKFHILTKHSKYDIEWNYCIDNRYTSPQELLEKYMALVDVPFNEFAFNDHRKEDEPFYDEFYTILAKNENICPPSFEIISTTSKPTVKGLVHGTSIVSTDSKVSRERIQKVIPLLEKWNEMMTTTRRIDNNNNRDYLHNVITFLDYIEEIVPILTKWCAEYASEVSFQDKLRGWLTYAIHGVKNDSLPIGFEKYWKFFFRRDDNKEDIITLNNITFDISYNHYISLCRDMKEEKNIEKCTIPEIIDIHKDIRCNGNNLTGVLSTSCIICEEQEHLWCVEVYKKYRNSNNIFMNKRHGELFIETWLDSVIKLSDMEQEKINYMWPPINIYSFSTGINLFKGNHITELSEFIYRLTNDRKNRYYGYEFRPKTESELMIDIAFAFSDYNVPAKLFEVCLNQCNEIYLFLSHILPYVPYIIHLDKKRCKELLRII